MAMMRKVWVLSVVGLIGAASAACTIGSPTLVTTSDDQTEDGDGGAKTTKPSDSKGGTPSGGPAPTCNGTDYAKPDLSKLTACGDGKGHCYDKAKSPMADQLVACADATKVCVPDEILLAGGNKLKSCTSIIGPGGCINQKLLPEMEKRAGSYLKQDVCDPGLVCAPCNNPEDNNAPTPFCQPIGVHESDCGSGAGGGGTTGGDAGAKPLQGCCTTKGVSNGVCLPESAIPDAQRSKTKKDTCNTGDKCVPAAMVKNQPVKCSSSFGAGVCMDQCFDDMMKIAGGIGILGRASCGSTELCIPCSFVSGQGVPGCQ